MVGLGAIVAVHLVITLVHGVAHTQAHVAMSAAGTMFVFGVIITGPLAGLTVALRCRRIGGLIVGLAMGGSLLFGVMNHFVLSSPDHVTQVEPAWRRVFTSSAVLLAITEAWAVMLAARLVKETR